MQSGKPEASTFSRSTTCKENVKAKKSLIDGQSQKIDKIFPLFHDMQKMVTIKSGFYLLMMIFIVFQIISVSFWEEYSWQFHTSDAFGFIIIWVIKITLFTSLATDDNDLLIRLILFAIVASTYVMLLMFQYQYYQVNRRFIKWTLTVTRVYVELINSLMVVPCSNFLGESIYLSVTTKEPVAIASLAVGLVFYAIFILNHYIMTNLFAETVYIPNSPNASWSGFFHFYFMTMAGVFAITGWVSKFFVSWTHPIVIGSKMFYDIYCLYRLFWLPFSQLDSNAMISTLHIILFVLDMLVLIQYFGIYIDYQYHIISFFISLILGLIITKNVIKYLVKKVKADLSEEALDDIVVSQAIEDQQNHCNVSNPQMCLSDARKRQLFVSLGLGHSKLKCLLYLRIGIATGAPLFIDWSLIKFVAEYHPSTEMMAIITQFICYFPCESRLLSYFYNITIMEPTLGIGQRFIIYQVHRVKDIRQSSASSDITEKLIELKNKTSSLVNVVKNYWTSTPRDVSLFYEIQKNTLMIDHLYFESIAKWPNNVRLSDDYSYFLIEGASDYVNGLKMKYRSELIEQGKSFIIDYCFRSLVRSYPLYLTKNIMDTHGNFLSKAPRKAGGSSNNSSSNSSRTLSVVGDLDAEVEDSLGKAAFTFPKLRIAYQKSLEDRNSKFNQLLKYTSFGSMITAIALNLFLFAWFLNRFTPRATNMDRQFVMNQIRYGYDAAQMTTAGYLNNRGVPFISNDLFGNCTYGMAMRSPRSNTHNLQWCDITHTFPPIFGNATDVPYDHKEINMLEEMQRWIFSSRDHLTTLLGDIEIDAQTINVYKEVSAIINNVVSFDFCMVNDNGDVMGIERPRNYSLQQILIYSLLKLNNLTQIRYGDTNGWAQNKGVCEGFINMKSIYAAFDSLTEDLSDVQITEKRKTKNEVITMLIFICIVFLVVWLPVLVVNVYLIRKEIRGLFVLIANIDKKNKDEATKQIKIGNVLDEDTVLSTNSQKKYITPAVLYSIVIFFIIFAVIIFVVIIMMSDIQNTHFLVLNHWLYYGIKRGNLMLEIYFFTFLIVFSAKKGDVVPMINRTLLTEMVNGMLKDLLDSNNKLLRGNDNDIDGEDLPPCIKLYPKLDAIHFQNRCPEGETSDGSNQSYSCLALDAGISLFNVYISNMIADPASVNVTIDSPFYFAFNMINNYMIDPAYEASQILSALAQRSINSYQVTLTILTFVAIFVHIFIFALMHAYLKRIDLAYDGAMHLLRRLPPLVINSNKSFLNFLLKKKDEEVVVKMCPCQAAIMNSNESVLFLSKSESIELVNKCITTVFGYTPDRLLGQSLSEIIPMDENSKVFEQIELMRNGEVPLIFESNAMGVTDDDQKIPVKITIIGTPDVHGKCAESFVVIMRDVSLFLKQQEEAEQAKIQSENLLYQILPRDIVVRLNRGEVDITFVVPSSTVIFIDIVKFSEYASTLTPAQIMENLSNVFASFDSMCEKFNLITKIKLIGDVYMAAAGLFTPEEPSASHACEVVQFGLDCITALEEINSNLNSSLQVRVGVNTDGPLIAGVLGIDKPVFDIIGDPINVAARLQSTGIPGTVQISKKTYDLVLNQGFNIEPRGEIMLKGKGKQPAYIVRQSDVGSFFTIANNDMPKI